MLLEFSCSNFKSIKSTILFSALAGTDTTHLEQVKEMGGLRVLRSGVIYGANGSGKSNLIYAITFVKNLVKNSIHFQPGELIPQTPHKTVGYSKKSTFKIQFLKNNLRYVFGFSLNNMQVSDEYLYYFPNEKQIKVFERKGDTFEEGQAFRGKLENCKDVLKENRLLLSCAANFSSVPVIEQAYRFFAEDIVIYNATIQEDWMQYTLSRIKDQKSLKEVVLAIMQSFGMGIKDIIVKANQKVLDKNENVGLLNGSLNAYLAKNDNVIYFAKVVYDSFETDLFTEESTGVRKLLALLGPLLDVMVNGKVLFCDELEAGLHESLIHELVRVFIMLETDKFPQLFFVTHDTSLLSLDLFRKDQIWFTEMRKKDRSTDLYSLVEIKNLPKFEKVEKGYIIGRYGAIPMLNKNLANIISKM